MKRKYLIILTIIVILLGAVYIIQQNRQNETWSAGTQTTILPENFNSDNLNAIKLVKAGDSITISRTDSGWQINERYNYPADFDKLKSLILQLCETRVAQQIPLDSAQASSLELTPDSGGIVVAMTDRNGKDIHRLIFGKKYESQSEQPMNPYGMPMGPSGRYIRLDDGSYIAASNAFSQVDSSLSEWLDKEFFKISDIKKAVYLHDGKPVWMLAKNDSGDFTLTGDIPDKKEVDSSKVTSFKNNFSWIRFSDVADPETVMDHAAILTVTDSDDIVYTIRTVMLNDKAHLRISAQWEGWKERTPGKDEKPEDKERLDAEYAKTIKNAMDKAKSLNDKLAKWTYIIDKSSFDNIPSTRDIFLKDKPEPEKKEDETAK